MPRAARTKRTPPKSTSKKRKKRAAARGPASPRPRASLENPAISLNDPAAWADLFGSNQSEAGIAVNESNALTVAPFWQAVNMISADVAAMTLNCHQRTADDDRGIDNTHPAQPLVSMRANRYESAYTVFRRYTAHGCIYQDAYIYIEKVGGRYGRPVGLYNLLPDRTCAAFDKNGELYYVTETDGQLQPLFPEEVLHLVGFSLEAHAGVNLVDKARNTIGLALAAQSFTSKFFANGAQAGGILEIPAGMGDVAKRNLEEGWSKKTNKDNWFKTAILRDGAKFHSTMVEAQKMQTSELMEAQATDAARFFNMPPFKLGIKGSVSYNSAEQGQKVYLTGCLNSWRLPIAAECNLKLLTEEQIKNNSHYFEHNTSVLIELDYAVLVDSLVKLRTAGIANSNECRRKLNWSKRTDPGGESYANPNINPEEIVDPSGGPPESDPAPGDDKPTDPTIPATEGADVQATALNGAQITSLLQICRDLVNEQLPPEGTRAIIEAAFPVMDKKLIDVMVKELDKFEPKPPEPDAKFAGGRAKGESAADNADDPAAAFGNLV